MLTRAAKPARPFDEELDLDLLTTLANATCLTRAGELRRDRLVSGWLWSAVMESSSAEEREGDGLACRFPFPLEGRRCMGSAGREGRHFRCKGMVGGNLMLILEEIPSLYTM